MTRMKLIPALLLMACLMFSLAACGAENNAASGNAGKPQETATPDT